MYEIINENKLSIIEKKSKFITRIIKVYSEKDAKNKITEIVKNEKGAVHNCYAYRISGENRDVIEKKNDDGEPGGTAGAPMLSVLVGENIVNVLVVTTRYFGGIKLGTGGLVNVYKKGVKEAIKKSGKRNYISYVKYKINFPINKTSLIQYELKKENILIIEKKFINKDVEFIISVPESCINKLDEIAATHSDVKLLIPH